MAAAQQMMISPEDLQQLLQASAAAQQPNLDWNANAELLHHLHQIQQVLTGPLDLSQKFLLYQAVLRMKSRQSIIDIRCRGLYSSPCGSQVHSVNFFFET